MTWLWPCIVCGLILALAVLAGRLLRRQRTRYTVGVDRAETDGEAGGGE